MSFLYPISTFPVCFIGFVRLANIPRALSAGETGLGLTSAACVVCVVLMFAAGGVVVCPPFPTLPFPISPSSSVGRFVFPPVSSSPLSGVPPEEPLPPSSFTGLPGSDGVSSVGSLESPPPSPSFPVLGGFPGFLYPVPALD